MPAGCLPAITETKMRIYLHEITDHDTDLDFTQEEKWVAKAVELVDENTESQNDSDALVLQQMRVDLKPKAAKLTDERRARVHFNLRKVDEVLVVSGDAEAQIELVC